MLDSVQKRVDSILEQINVKSVSGANDDIIIFTLEEVDKANLYVPRCKLIYFILANSSDIYLFLGPLLVHICSAISYVIDADELTTMNFRNLISLILSMKIMVDHNFH